MILNSTFYKNPERTISGLSNFVSTADTIILCDTSLGIVYLNLLEIPNDQWNTTYKLYVVDKSNNAGTNAIAIFAPAGYTINNQSSLIIDADGGAVVIRVASNTGYLGSLTYNVSGSSVSVVNSQNPFTPPVTLTTALDKLVVSGFQTTNAGNDVYLSNAFVKIDTTQLAFLITNEALIPNQIYQVGGFIFGNSPDLVTAFVKATSPTTLDTYGTGMFFNADYQYEGDYSDVVGFVNQLGIWTSALVVVAGDVVIWNNYHYKNLTGVNTANNPVLDTTNWQILSYSETNGYIVEYDLVGGTNLKGLRLTWRKDKYKNYVENYTDSGLLNSLNRFQWGNANCFNNNVSGKCIFDICNVIHLELANNWVRNVRLYLNDNIVPSQFGYFSENNFTDCNRPMKIKGSASTNEFRHNSFHITDGVSLFTLNSNATFRYNNFVNSALAGEISDCIVAKNEFNLSSVVIRKTGGQCDSNSILRGTFFIQGSTGVESGNSISGGQLNVTLLNEGNIQNNNIQNGSGISVVSNSPTGLIRYNVLSNNSFIEITDLNKGSIGDGGVKGEGNTLENESTLQLSFIETGKEIYSNTISSSSIEIPFVDGTISKCTIIDSTITLASMNNWVLVGLKLKLATLGFGGYILPETYSGGEYIKGNGSIRATLDLADVTIYDPITFTITIPTPLKEFAGMFVLKNANLRIIDKIQNLNSEITTQFTNDNGVTTFNIAGVGVATPYQIIGDASAPPSVAMVYRINGTDSILLNALGTLCGITELNIYA